MVTIQIQINTFYWDTTFSILSSIAWSFVLSMFGEVSGKLSAALINYIWYILPIINFVPIIKPLIVIEIKGNN